jgi:mannose/fructose/N-acetylgalactosamine-specific phosphotransferase system component IID
MYLILIAWMYVAVMMAAAEAMSPVGSILGAIVTFVLYGVVPVAILAYIMGTPARKRARLAREQASNAVTPDANSKASSDAIAPERKEL